MKGGVASNRAVENAELPLTRQQFILTLNRA